MAAGVMAAAIDGKMQSSPAEYVLTYFEMLEQMREHVANRRRKGAPPGR
jgi:hypothetical protein